METNEAILARDVVIIDAHKKLGGIKALRVDCDKMAVSHYIINNESTGSTLVLPFEKALAVGDTFMTVQSRNDFLAADDAFSNKVIKEGYVLLKEQVFSKTGNKLSPVKGFEFDTVEGAVTKLELEDGSSYDADTFIFFSQDFVFIDDGAPTAPEQRASKSGFAEATSVAAPSVAGYAPVSFEAPEAVAEVVAEVEAVVEAEDVAEVVEEVEAELELEAPVVVIEEEIISIQVSDEEETITDDEIIDFLVGATLQADVESEDKEFKAEKGTVLTREIIVAAAEHDAILLLTINVEV
ncbi:MAG: hypothetical protein FWE96_00415 [Coriobacteriia bacterium]|nr:hypothetical protein [Coriobacteriia bacterium]